MSAAKRKTPSKRLAAYAAQGGGKRKGVMGRAQKNSAKGSTLSAKQRRRTRKKAR